MAVLLLLSVALLTAYFRESDSGVAHSVQGAVLTVVSPLQSGTATVTKPFRDAWNWVGDLFSAKSENKSLKKEVQQLRAGLAEELTTQAENDQLRAMLQFQKDHVFPKGVTMVTARVIGALDQRLVLHGDHQCREQRRGRRGRPGGQRPGPRGARHRGLRELRAGHARH